MASRTFLVITFVWFVFQAVYMALSTHFGVPADENYHFLFIKFITENGWTPFFGAQTDHFFLGEVVKTPFFLYHYLLSLPSHLFINSEHAVLILRLANILLAVGSLYVLYKIANQIKISPLARNLSIFMLANTLMFVFLSAAINYDNLFIFLSMASVWLLLLLIEKVTLRRFLLFLIVLASGLMAKVNFLPVAAIVVVILLFKLRRSYKSAFTALKKTAGQSKKLNIGLAIFLLLLSGLFLQRYALNLLEYRDFEPNCTQVLTLDQCRQNEIYARNEMIKNTPRKEADKNIAVYVMDWTRLMRDRTYGIFSHRSADPTVLIKAGVVVLLVLTVLAFARKPQVKNGLVILLVIYLFYLGVLLFDNHDRYREFGVFTLAVQGRYMLGVLPLFYILANTYILDFLKNKRLQSIYCLAVVAVFITAGLPSYIYVTTPEWHNPKAIEINQQLKDLLQFRN